MKSEYWLINCCKSPRPEHFRSQSSLETESIASRKIASGLLIGSIARSSDDGRLKPILCSLFEISRRLLKVCERVILKRKKQIVRISISLLFAHSDRLVEKNLSQTQENVVDSATSDWIEYKTRLNFMRNVFFVVLTDRSAPSHLINSFVDLWIFDREKKWKSSTYAFRRFFVRAGEGTFGKIESFCLRELAGRSLVTEERSGCDEYRLVELDEIRWSVS